MTFFFLGALASVTRALGDFREPNYALVSVVMIGLLWRSFPVIPGWNRAINWLIRWSSWALATGLIFAADPLLRIVMLTAAVWAFDRYGAAGSRGANRPLVVLGALYALGWSVFFQLPTGYRWLLSWSFNYSEFVTRAMTIRLPLGPSAQGIDLLILGISGVLAFCVIRRRPQWLMAVLMLFALEAARILYIWIAPTMANIVSAAIPVSSTAHLDMPAVYFLMVAALLGLLKINSTTLSVESRQSVRWSPVTIGAAAVVILSFVVAGAASYTDRPIRVLMPSSNVLDQNVPHHGRYGDRSGGMFGFLPIFLESCGHKVYRGEPTKEMLDSIDVIFIANLIDKFSPEYRQNIWDFIERGGGLVIVGDHTGTEAIRDPTNDLLAPCGMEINFDTAVPMRRSWAAAKSFLFHPLGRSGRVMDAELWLGASVDPGPNGEPFVIGRGAFSDPGDLNNKDRSFLGNLEYDAGEPLGDVVLAAAAHWGKGRAILHGDTSPYQNGTMVRSHSLINRSIRWAASNGPMSFVDRWRLPILTFMIGIVGVAFVALSVSQPILLWAALLLPALSISLWTNVQGAPHPKWEPHGYKAAIIDDGHLECYDLMAWEDRSIGALMYNLMRNEYSPRFCSSPHALDEYPAEMYVICTPSVPFSRSEIDRLEQFVDDGGWLMIAAGWDKREAVGPLLDRFGLAIDNIPLGEAEAFGMGKTVKMKNAYPVKGQGEGVETLITAFDYPVAKVVRRGTGGVIEIGDSEFLLNMNLEGQNDFLVMENIVFLRSLMATLNQDPS